MSKKGDKSFIQMYIEFLEGQVTAWQLQSEQYRYALMHARGVISEALLKGEVMEDYQKRVVDEKKALDEKITKLEAFVEGNPNFDNLDEDEGARLERQLTVMREYSEILGKRIAWFNGKEGTMATKNSRNRNKEAWGAAQDKVPAGISLDEAKYDPTAQLWVQIRSLQSKVRRLEQLLLAHTHASAGGKCDIPLEVALRDEGPY